MSEALGRGNSRFSRRTQLHCYHPLTLLTLCVCACVAHCGGEEHLIPWSGCLHRHCPETHIDQITKPSGSDATNGIPDFSAERRRGAAETRFNQRRALCSLHWTTQAQLCTRPGMTG